VRLWQVLWAAGTPVVLTLFVIAIPARFAQLQVATPVITAAWAALDLTPVVAAVYYSVIEIGIAVAYVVVGLLIAFHRPRDWFAWFTSLALILAGVTLPATLGALAGLGQPRLAVARWTGLHPDGRGQHHLLLPLPQWAFRPQLGAACQCGATHQFSGTCHCQHAISQCTTAGV
jgi:hypothetical protein